ncbi:MAG: hypothetical protein MJZ12_06570 [Prevotella sp.]|nr:hypothetical protein [Prevotella sp.]
MKKLFFAALVAAMATTSFAQDITKEMKGKSFAEAQTVLKGALGNLSAEQKAKGYAMLTDIAYKDASAAYDVMTINQTTGKKDPVNYDAICDVIESAVACDPFDNQPNDKGKVAPKFHKKNLDRLQNMRIALVVGGQEAQSAENNAQALKLYSCYVNSAFSSLFEEVAGKKDQNAGQVSRVVAYLFAQKEDYVTAQKYAEIAMADTASAKDSEGIYVAILEKQCKTHADTLNFINKLKEINPQKYFPQMASLYDRIGEKEMAAKLLDEEIAANPTNKMAYAIKGENAMNARDWDKAIENFKKTVEIDPSFTAVWFNLGVCASSKGFDLNEQLSNNGRITTENAAKVNAVLTDAKKYYEKVKELDPDRNVVPNWPYQLRMIYNALGETENANAISKMLGE